MEPAVVDIHGNRLSDSNAPRAARAGPEPGAREDLSLRVRGAQPWIPEIHRDLVLGSAHDHERLDRGPIRVGALEGDLFELLYSQETCGSLRGSKVLVCPGYGNLPMLCVNMHARLVVAVDKDPATIAWQQALLWFGASEAGDDNPSEIFEGQKHWQVPLGSKRNRIASACSVLEPNEEPLYDNLAYVCADATHSLPQVEGGYDTIIVPYLVDVPKGVRSDSPGFEAMLDNFASALSYRGQICIFPAFAEGGKGDHERATWDAFPVLEEWTNTRPFNLSRTEDIRLYNAFPLGGAGCAALLSRG